MRIQPGRDPEQMAHGIGVAVPVQVGVQAVGVGRQPVAERRAVFGDGVQLGAVAGGQHARPPDTPGSAAQRGQRGGQGVGVERDALAQADRRGLVVDS